MSRILSFYVLCSLVIAFFSKNSHAQENSILVDNLLQTRKRFDLEKLEVLASNIKDENLKGLVLADLYYQQSGLILEHELGFSTSPDRRMNAMSKYLYADALKRKKNKDDSLVFRLYFDALNTAMEDNDSLMVNTILPKMNRHLLSNGVDMRTYLKYVNLSWNYARDSVDFFNFYYYRLGYEMRRNENDQTISAPTLYDSLFEKGLSYAIKPYFKGYMQQFKGIYYDAYLSENQKALGYYEMALENYAKDSLYYSIKGVSSIAFNRAIINYNLGNYQKSAAYFRKHEHTETNPVYLMYNYEWLHKNYEQLGIMDSAYFYFKKMVAAKEALRPYGHVIEIRDIESRYDLDKKEQELKALTTSQQGLLAKNKKLILGFSIVSLSVILLFFWNKRFRSRNRTLEKEQSETLQKLDELKDIVTKDFIVLRDKSKVYVSELVFVKSDDHYLKVHLADGSTNFVRGKLHELNEQLPPNFVRCHRSYIINKNYIEQLNAGFVILKKGIEIPISRTYKSNITDR